MNLTTAIMLVNTSVRPIRVTYDPDTPTKNNPDRLFKTFDPSIAKDDYVVVPTSTRHGFTVCKVEETDFVVDFDTSARYDWVVGKVDKSAYDSIVEQEKLVISRIGKAEENRKRKELADAMGLAAVNFTDLDVVKSNAQLAAPVSPRGEAAPPTPSPSYQRRRPPEPTDDDFPF